MGMILAVFKIEINVPFSKEEFGKCGQWSLNVHKVTYDQQKQTFH